MYTDVCKQMIHLELNRCKFDLPYSSTYGNFGRIVVCLFSEGNNFLNFFPKQIHAFPLTPV